MHIKCIFFLADYESYECTSYKLNPRGSNLNQNRNSDLGNKLIVSYKTRAHFKDWHSNLINDTIMLQKNPYKEIIPKPVYTITD